MVDMRHDAVRSTRLIKTFRTDEMLFRHRQLKNAGNASRMRSTKHHTVFRADPQNSSLTTPTHPGMWFASLQFTGHATFMTT